jgi:hypothetical protein
MSISQIQNLESAATIRSKLNAVIELINSVPALNPTHAHSVANMTLDDTNLVVAKSTNVQSWIEEADAALYRARGTGVTTTYACTVTIAGTTFNHGAVAGEISGDLGFAAPSYAGATGITLTDLTAISTYVYVDSAGALQQQTTQPTRQDWTRKMFTMRIAVDTTTNQIINFVYLNNPIGHYANSMRDMYEILREQGISWKKGLAITGRADLLFDIGAGQLFEFGGTGDIFNPHLKNFDAETGPTFTVLSRSAILSDETELPLTWDNGSGSSIIIPSTEVVAHRLYRFSSGQIALQEAQYSHGNMAAALVAVPNEAYVLNPRLENAVLLGWWCVLSNASATNNTAQAVFKKYIIGVR